MRFSFRSEGPGDSFLNMMIRGLLRRRVATIRETHKPHVRALNFGQRGWDAHNFQPVTY